jgi:hypothetical protein
MMPPQPGLEIVLRAVFYNDFAPLALGIGNSMAPGPPRHYIR